MSEISGSAKFKIYYQMSLHHYFSRMYMYILIEKYLLHSIHINNKLLTSISIHLLKLFVLIKKLFSLPKIRIFRGYIIDKYIHFCICLYHKC